MTPGEAVALRAVGHRFTMALSARFERERLMGRIDLPEGPDSSQIGRVRDHGEARLVAVALIDAPAPGLVVSVSHWSVPRGSVLDVFVPAHGRGGVLTGEPVIPLLPVIHFCERLESRGFASSWTPRADHHLYAALYDDSFPA